MLVCMFEVHRKLDLDLKHSTCKDADKLNMNIYSLYIGPTEDQKKVCHSFKSFRRKKMCME